MQRFSVIPVLALLLACDSKGPDATPTQPPTAAVEPGSADGGGEAKPDPTDEALERVPKVLETVAKLRNLDVKKQIGASRETPDEFRKFVTGELEKEIPKEEAKVLSVALRHFGLIKKEINIREAVEDALVSQVGAYYDPKRETFFVVMASGNAMFADMMNAHELMHGLQDQHFDLEGFLPEKELSGDAVNARRFLVEGEATLLMTLYPGYVTNGVNLLDNKDTVAMVEQQVTMMEKMSLEQMLKSNAEGAKAAEALGGDFAKAAEAMDELPMYITVPLGLPYVRGMGMVFRVHQAGGWDAVSKLYAEPPASTEQALHPVEKLIKKRDEPVKITLPKQLPGLETYKEVEADVMGEMMWDTYFSLWGVNDKTSAAGWGGDRFALLHQDGKHVGVVASVWDSKKDAEEFADGYIKTLGARFDGAKPKTRGGVTVVERGDGTVVVVQRKGDAVAIVDGADEKTGRQAAGSLLKAKRG